MDESEAADASSSSTSVCSRPRDVNDKIVVCGARPRQIFATLYANVVSSCGVDEVRGGIITLVVYSIYRLEWRRVSFICIKHMK